MMNKFSVNTIVFTFIFVNPIDIDLCDDYLQAGFSYGTIAYMCLMFAVTTPMGIILGMALFALTGYDDSNPNALIM